MSTEISSIAHHLRERLSNEAAYRTMSTAHNPYGDAIAQKIALEILEIGNLKNNELAAGRPIVAKIS